MSVSRRSPTPSRPFFGPSEARPMPWAHRGGAQRYPENTLIAFEGSYAMGYRWFETDVQLAKDGTIVVHHDLTLDRTTDGTGPVAERTLQELKALDAGCRFTPDGRTYPYTGRGATVPTLEEVLFFRPDHFLTLEMKGQDMSLPERLWEAIQRFGVEERVLVASGNDALTARFRRLAGDAVPTSAGRNGIVRFWAGVRTGLGRFGRPPFEALQVPLRHGKLRVVDAAFVRAAHAKGIQVHVWTINDPVEMRQLVALGVDAIMTDRPQVLLETLEGQRRSPE
ncbi:MAG: glycerophosphodiester phosphodiesterase [Myxococcota bacterium]